MLSERKEIRRKDIRLKNSIVVRVVLYGSEQTKPITQASHCNKIQKFKPRHSAVRIYVANLFIRHLSTSKVPGFAVSHQIINIV